MIVSVSPRQNLAETDVRLGGATRERGDQSAEATAVLGRRVRVGRVLDRADVFDGDVAVVDRIAHETQVGAGCGARAPKDHAFAAAL